MPPARRTKHYNKAFSRKQAPLALAQAIFQAVGFDGSTTGYVLKEEALSAWETLQAMEEVALKSFPRYVTGGFFRDGGAPNIRTTMTFLRRVARYVGRVVAREKFHRRIEGRLKTYYRYRILSK
jgi:hypothetical protein